jgi:DNA (cytosine-5)-methyltransferase 1
MTPDRPMRVLDLFSGIGGFSLGLERAGFRTIAFCEVLPKPRHLLNHYWPDTPCYDDVNTLTGERLVADGIVPDALCGGFPCQDLSYAGKGAGLDGARSGLWFQIARLLRELRDLGRPVRFVILENVSALLGRGLGVVLGDLAALGYDAEWDCIPASAVGAPHRRDRIWIVAYPRGEQHEGFGDAFRRALAQELSEAALAHADLEGLEGRHGEGVCERAGERPAGAGSSSVADPDGERSQGRGVSEAAWRGQSIDPAGSGSSVRREALRHGGFWATEPNVGRVAHGVPARVDRLHGLGNAVVPEIPYRLGRAILTAIAAEPLHSSPQAHEGRAEGEIRMNPESSERNAA